VTRIRSVCFDYIEQIGANQQLGTWCGVLHFTEWVGAMTWAILVAHRGDGDVVFHKLGSFLSDPLNATFVFPGGGYICCRPYILASFANIEGTAGREFYTGCTIYYQTMEVGQVEFEKLSTGQFIG